MHIEPFAVEMWMNDWETRCRFNLAETCVESLTLGDLLALCSEGSDELLRLADLKLSYGDIKGLPRLRKAIAALYTNTDPERIITTHGTIGANMLVHKALVAPKDHVVAIVPTYQQHTSIPESIGARVDRLALNADQAYEPDLDRLKDLVTTETKLIALTNPNNPTGALIPEPMMQQIVEIARQADAWILCDEVYRGTGQDGDGESPSFADLYEKGVATAGMSKAFSLAGLRVGWINGPHSLIEIVERHRDYDTISVGKLDEHFAALALENADAILARSHEITRTNLKILSDWVDKEPRITWVKPQAGTTALLHYDMPIPSRDLCLDLITKTGVMLMPGSALGVEHSLRIGFANPTQDLIAGLEVFSGYLAQLTI